MRDSQRTSMRRSGFTLIEILVVIAIILILSGLTFWGVNAAIKGRYRGNTIATISVVNRVLQDHWRYVIEEARKDTISPAVMALASPDPDGSRAKALWIKFRLMEAFPQNYLEITHPFVYSNSFIPPGQQRYNATYLKLLPPTVIANPTTPAKWTVMPITASSYTTTPITQSSACLRLALSVSRGGNALTDDMIKYAIADTDTNANGNIVGDGLPEIVDSWGTPLQFFRFPWNQSALQAANPAGDKAKNLANAARNVAYADPVDNGGTFINATWYFAPAPTNYRTPLGENLSLHPFALPGLPTTWNYMANQRPAAVKGAQLNWVAPYTTSVIVSAGPDRIFGLTVINPGTNLTGAWPMTGNLPMPTTVTNPNPEDLLGNGHFKAQGMYLPGGTDMFHPEMSISPSLSANATDDLYSFLQQ